MQQSDWPKKFFYSREKLSATRRNFAILLLVFVAHEVLVFFSDRNPLRLLWLGALTFLFLWGTTLARRPAAELWPDHVRLPHRWLPKLISIDYAQITRLEKIPNQALVVVYVSSFETHKTGVNARWLPTVEEFEAALKAKTGLEVTSVQPWWSRLMELSDIESWERPGGWRQHFLLPLHMIPAAFLAALVVLASYFVFVLFGKELPVWLAVSVAAATGCYFQFWMRRRRVGKQKRKEGVEGLAKPESSH